MNIYMNGKKVLKAGTQQALGFPASKLWVKLMHSSQCGIHKEFICTFHCTTCS